MSHHRTVIREAIVAALIAASTAAGARVYDHPYNPRKTFPALVVEDFGANYSEGNVTEMQAPHDVSESEVVRRYRFVVIAEVQQSTDSAGERDDLVAEVEVAIEAAFVAGDIPVQNVSPIGYQSSDDNTAEKPIRRGLQIYEATYITPKGTPSTTL